MFMKPSAFRFKPRFPAGGSLGGFGGGGGSSGGGGTGQGQTFESGSQDQPSFGDAGGVPDFARVKENVFAAKYGARNLNNQHVTPECIAQMVVGATKYTKAKALGLVFTGGINTANGGGDVSDSTPYNAHHQGKLVEMVMNNDLEPATGCEQMGFNVAKAHDEAKMVEQKNIEIEKNKKELLDGLGKIKSASGDAQME